LPFVVAAQQRVVPELKRRLRLALQTRDADVLYGYLSRVLFVWDRSLVSQFKSELEDCVRLGPICGEEHDAEAACLIVRHQLTVQPDVAEKLSAVMRAHPLVVKLYGLD
jgi:hypothetical protein